jgi:hypothetical protein
VRSTAISGVRFVASLSFASSVRSVVRRCLACLLLVGEHRSSIAVGHLPDLDDLRAVHLPFFGRQQAEIACFQEVAFGFVRRLTRRSPSISRLGSRPCPLHSWTRPSDAAISPRGRETFAAPEISLETPRNYPSRELITNLGRDDPRALDQLTQRAPHLTHRAADVALGTNVGADTVVH